MTKPFKQRLLYGTRREILGEIKTLLKDSKTPLSSTEIFEHLQKKNLNPHSKQAIFRLIQTKYTKNEVEIIRLRKKTLFRWIPVET